jgi:hypothetical protein
MTFFEAAVEVLRQAGRALHYKKITEMAIEQHLLSHVGRTPHVTMEARLSQEAEKEDEGTIRRVRPGVYVLAEGRAAGELVETERGEPSGRDEEPLLAVENDEGGEQGPWRRRRRRRRNFGEEPGEDKDPAPAPERPKALERPRYPTLADAVTEALSAAPQPMTAQELAKRLSQEPDDPVSPLFLEQAMRGANRRLARSGARPLFTRLEQGWVLTQSELDPELADIYDGLERTHGRLLEGTIEALVRAVEKLHGRDLEAFVRATLDGLGYDVSPLDRTPEAALFAARQGEGLVPIKAAVSVWHDSKPLTGNAVAALRGRLHRYGATHGVAVSVRRGGIDPSARSEVSVSGESQPVVLLDAHSLAPLALRAGVGVVHYDLEVPLLDVTWFGNGPAD